MDQPNVRKITLNFVLGWIVGIIILVSSFSLFGIGSYIAGSIAVISALLMIPYFDKLIADKLHVEVSNGMKVLLAIVGMVAIFSGVGSMVARSLDGDKQGKVIETTTSSTTAAVVDAAPSDIENKCPDIIKGASKYEIAYSQSEAGHKQLYLSAGFVTDLKFSDDYELDNKPNIGNEYMYSSQSFICDPGSEAGQSTNKLYCRSTYIYEPTLKHKNIDRDGNVVSADTKDIEYFIFDITDKDLNRANDLKNLKLEGITCK